MQTASIPILAGVLAIGLAAPAAAQINKALVDAAPDKQPAPMPHIDPDNPNSLPIKQDDSTDIWRTLRAPARNPGRQPGPIDIQRYVLQMEPVGIKTFSQLPIALPPEDLKAGAVDVAIFGAPQGVMAHSAGDVWAPATIRYNKDYGGSGPQSSPLGFIEFETLINPFDTLDGVDQGDAARNDYSYERMLEEIWRVTREIAETDAIPFCVGGDHSTTNATFRGIEYVYGRKHVAFFHFDAHLDRSGGKMGAFYHFGSFLTGIAMKKQGIDLDYIHPRVEGAP